MLAELSVCRMGVDTGVKRGLVADRSHCRVLAPSICSLTRKFHDMEKKRICCRRQAELESKRNTVNPIS